MILTNILKQYEQVGERWFAVVNQYSHELFFTLALLDTIWFGTLIAINRQRLDYVFLRITLHVLGLGWFLTMLINGREWTKAIINSFVRIGQEGSGVRALDPSSVVDQAIAIAGNMFATMGIWGTMSHPATALGSALSALIAFLCMALVAGHMTYILIRTNLVIAMAPMLLSFAGSRWTRQVAGKYIAAVLGSGMTLTALYFMIALAESLTQGWAEGLKARTGVDFTIYLEVIISAIIYGFLVHGVPAYVSDMFSGTISLSMVELERTGEMFSSYFRGWGGDHGGNHVAPVSPITPPSGHSPGGGTHSNLTAPWSNGTSAASQVVSKAASTATGGVSSTLQQFRQAGNGPAKPSAPKGPTQPPTVKNPQLQQTLNKWHSRGQ